MKKLVLVMVFALYSTTLLAGNVSEPVMDPQVVAATVEEVSGPSKDWWIPLLIITIGLIGL